MVLVNAIHLKFAFQFPFDASGTRPAPFTKADGSIVMAPFMNIEANYMVSEDASGTTISLPFRGGRLTTLVTLPKEGTSLDSYEARLVASSPALTATGAQPGNVILSIPKIEFTSKTFSLKPGLMAMGMASAFTKSAEFTGLCANRPLYIDQVLQKAMIEMDETGVEAAAATAVVLPKISIAPPPPRRLVIDRPYLVAIVDQVTGAVLFVGRIEDPTDAGGR